MEIIKLNSRITNEERETILVYDNIDKIWTMDSTIAKHFNKAKRQGWTPIAQYVYDDGTVGGMALSASERAITIRNVEKKKMSEAQMDNLSADEDEEE